MICGGNLRCISKLLRGAEAKLFRENEALKRKIAEEQLRRTELEDAVIELGSLFAEQDDALVELAEMIVEV